MAATQEIGDERKAQRLALLRMELRARDIVAAHHGGDGAAMIGGGNHIVSLIAGKMEGMHEIGMQPVARPA